MWRVPPLGLPEAGDDLDALLAGEAVALFAERAAAARPGFVVDAGNAEVVVALCIRLDGLPLAIELAAARVRGLTPQRILDGLAQRFALLTGGGRSVPVHQQTLEASIAWSHDLLTEPQQILLRRLAVFAGRFSLDDVEAAAAADPLTAWDCLVLLADLVDRSLVVFDGEHYRLLATIASYAEQRLADAAETAAIRAAHLQHFAALAAAGAADLNAAPTVENLHRIEVARPNCLAAIEHALTVGDHSVALAITADLGALWHLRSRYAESLAYLRKVLAATPETDSRDRARLLFSIGQLALYGMDLANSYGIPESTRAIEMAQATGAADVEGRALFMRYMPTVFMAPDQALEHLPRAQVLALAGGDRFGANLATAWHAYAATWSLDRPDLAAPSLARLDAESRASSPFWAHWHGICAGSAALHAGRLAEAVALLEAAVAGGRAFGDSQTEFFAAFGLADAYVDLGEHDAAERVVASCVEWQDRSALGRAEITRVRRVRYLLAQGDLAAAAAELTAVEEIARAIGFDFGMCDWELVAARLAEETGDLTQARRAVDEANRLAAGIGIPWAITAAVQAEGRVARAEGRLGAAEEAHHRALALCAEHGYAHRAAEVLEALASLATIGESWAEAARLYGVGDALRQQTGFRRPPIDAPRAEADLVAITAALGAEAHTAASAEGAALSLAQAVAYASRARGERKRPSVGWDALTPTELRVVELIAAGLTNPDIGAKLFITTGTVKAHVHNIFTKLGITRRSNLAAQATERRLIDT